MATPLEMVWLIAGGLAMLLGLLILVLSLPVEIRLSAEMAPDLDWRVEARALGGRAPRMRFGGGPGRRRGRRVRRDRAAKPADAEGKGRVPARAIPALVADVLREVRFRGVEAEGDYGFADPAVTGQVCGLLSPFRCIYGDCVSLRPVFDRPVLQGRLSALISVRPIALVPPLVRFGLRASRGR